MKNLFTAIGLRTALWAGDAPAAAGKYVVGVLLLIVLLAVDGRAWAAAPTLKWNEDSLTWVAPTQCSDGSPITDCPISGYRIETAPLATSTTWSTLTTVAGTSTLYLRTSVPLGQSCYRVLALSGSLASPPSNVSCTTTVGPAPGAPVLQAIDSLAFDVRFDFRKFAFVVNRKVGEVTIGTGCRDDFRIKGTDLYRVPREAVQLDRSPRSAVLVAHCA